MGRALPSLSSAASAHSLVCAHSLSQVLFSSPIKKKKKLLLFQVRLKCHLLSPCEKGHPPTVPVLPLISLYWIYQDQVLAPILTPRLPVKSLGTEIYTD